jgi:starch synthase
MIASEAQPFSKTGGLADVATALPKALGRLGHDVTLITPRYRGIADGPIVDRLSLEVAGHRFTANLIEARIGTGARVLLLDCPELYDRSGIYYDARGDYADNAVRFAFLSAAAIDWASQKDDPFDIVHSHDWQGGLAPIYSRALAVPRVPKVPTVFTIHNLAYQGVFEKSWVPRLGLSWPSSRLVASSFSIA